MAYPKKNRLISNMDGTFRSPEKVKSRYKPKPFVESEIVKNYRYERDMAWLADPNFPEETKEQIREIWKDRM